MRSNSYIVVGEAYEKMAQMAPVVTESRMLELLERDSLGGFNVVIGQGLGSGARRRLDQVAAGGASNGVSPQQAALPLTHKRDERHVLIGTPSQVGPARYQAALVVDDASDRLCDHVTGAHLAGMLLIEATRQLVIASLELEFGRDGAAMPFSIGWNGLTTRFLAFVFPLPARLTAVVSEDEDKRRPTQRSVLVEVTLEQAGQVALETRYDIALMQRSTFELLEARRAKRAAERIVQQATPEATFEELVSSAP